MLLSIILFVFVMENVAYLQAESYKPNNLSFLRQSRSLDTDVDRCLFHDGLRLMQLARRAGKKIVNEHKPVERICGFSVSAAVLEGGKL